MELSPLERQAAFAAAAKLRGMSRVDAAQTLGATWTHVRRGLVDPSAVGPALGAKILTFLAPVAALGEKVAQLDLPKSA